METLEESVVARPALKRLRGLLEGGLAQAPRRVRRALEAEDLSSALEAARQRWSRGGPDDLVGAVTYAALLVVRDLLDEARGVIDKAAARHPQSVALQVIRAERAARAEDPSAARELLEAAVDADIASATLAEVIGDLWLDLGDDARAQLAYERAVSLGSRDLEVGVRAAQLAAQHAQWERAAEAFEHTAGVAGERVGLWRAAADAWHEAGDDARSLRAAGRALQIEQAEAHDWLHHGLAQARVGDFEAARASLERCLDLDPFDLDARVSLGQVLLKEGRVEPALASFQEVLRVRPDDVDASLGVVAACHHVGDLARAERAARDAVAALEDDPETHHSLGVTLHELGRHDEAVDSLHRAVTLASEVDLPDEAYRASLALALIATGRAEEAIEAITADGLVSPAARAAWSPEIVEALLRRGEFTQARQLMAEHPATEPAVDLLYALFDAVISGYEGHDPTRHLERAEGLLLAHPDIAPIDWDLAHISRLSLRFDRAIQRRLTALVRALEGYGKVPWEG